LRAVSAASNEGAFDPVVAALGDPLTRPLGAAAVGAAGKEAAEAADVTLGAEAVGGVEHADQDGGEVLADPGNGAKDIVRLEFCVEHLDAAVEVADGLDVGEHSVDLDGDFRLELDEVDMGAVQDASLSGGVAQTLDESIDERAAAGMIATGVPGDGADDDGFARGEHRVGVEPLPQQGQGETCPQVRQDALEGRRGPTDKVDQAPLAGGDPVLEAAALLGEPLERMAPGGGDMHRVETRPPEAGHGGQHLGVGEVGRGRAPRGSGAAP
jgi:hypothetical protein